MASAMDAMKFMSEQSGFSEDVSDGNGEQCLLECQTCL